MSNIFISYRHDVSATLACALEQNFRSLGYDVFLDMPCLERPQQDPMILRQLELCPYFLLLLTPGTLTLCVEPDDYLREEIQLAAQHRHQFILMATPLFDSADFARYLPPELSRPLQQIKPLKLRHEYADETIFQLRARGLTPNAIGTSAESADSAEQMIRQYYLGQPRITFRQLNAQRAFEQALAAPDIETRLKRYSEAVNEDSTFAQAYYNRGAAYFATGDKPAAEADYKAAIALNPALDRSRYTRGTVRYEQTPSPSTSIGPTSSPNPVLGVVEVPLVISNPTRKIQDLYVIAQGWVDYQGKNWTPEIPAALLVEQARLKFVAYWLISCEAYARWTGKVVGTRRGLGSYFAEAVAGGPQDAHSVAIEIRDKRIPVARH